MGKLFFLISAIIIVSSGHFAASAADETMSYQWWFDNDVSAVSSGTFGSESFDIDIDVAGLPRGTHYFNCRIISAEGAPGAAYRRMVLVASGNTAASEYEYWFDNDYDSRTHGNVTTGENQYLINLDDVRPGLHRFNYRLRFSDGSWGAVSTNYFYLAPGNSVCTEYEYWLDNDYASRKTVGVSGSPIVFDVDLDGASSGLHSFNCRLRDGGDKRGAVSTTYFYVTKENVRADQYEYWLDNDYASRTTVKASGNIMTFDIGLDGVSKGFHRFNCRLSNSRGERGTVASTYFYLGAENAYVAEYWLDGDFASRKTAAATGKMIPLDFDMDGTDALIGLHSLSCRLQADDGRWGAVTSTYFTITPEDIRVAEYEYWLDDDYASRKSDKVTGPVMTFDIDVAGLERKGEIHRFNYRLRNSSGTWGAVSSAYYFIAAEADILRKVTGYRHYINGRDLGYVAINDSAGDSIVLYADIPDDLPLNIRNKKPIFDGNTVTIGGTDTISYSIQLQTASEWIQPWSHELTATNSVSATAVEMRVNSHSTLATPEEGKFGAVKFSAPGQPLYFLASIPVDLDLYKDGEKVSEIAASDLSEMAIIELAAGEYYGILHDAQSNNTDFVLRIMDTPDAVPSPRITYDEGLVSITCSRADAEIHYTLDRTTPTAESTLYSEPFAITQSSVVKAIAIVPDTDLEPSEVSELEITLRSGSVTISYNGRYVTITADENDARIYYTLDASADTPDIEYHEPFDAMGLATVRAFAAKDGFTDSDIAEYSIRGYADEIHAETAEGGQLAKCYGWTSREALDNLDALRIEGRLNDEDFTFIRSLAKLRHLDLENVTGVTLPAGALSGLPLVTVNMPADIAGIGDRVFDPGVNLCAVVWNSTATRAEGRIFGEDTNPNLLLYLPYSASREESGVANRVESGVASSIELKDGSPFLAPIDFYAQSITYTRNFSKETLIGSCSGWETLSLPFDVETISDATGEATPFAKAGPQDRPFWLYRPTGNGWEPAEAIHAYLPYLISMPNNKDYADYYNIRGDVTFSASDITVSVTPDPEGFPYKAGASLWPSFSSLAADDNRWVINDDWFENDIPGSVFVSGQRGVRPFECYLTSDGEARRIPVFDAGVTGIEELITEGDIRIWTDAREICILSRADRRLEVCDIAGHVVRIIDVTSGAVERIRDLPTGLYFIAKRKVFLR